MFSQKCKLRPVNHLKRLSKFFNNQNPITHKHILDAKDMHDILVQNTTICHLIVTIFKISLKD